jgi:hypothetical protein
MSEPGMPDWKSLSAEAAEAPADALNDVEPVDSPTVVDPPAPETPPSVDPVAVEPIAAETISPAEPKIFEAPDDALFRIKVDGEEKIVSYKDYKDILRQNVTVTQRYQNLAETRDKMNAELATWIKQLEEREAALNAKATATPAPAESALQALVDALQGKTPPKPKDPNEILTHGELAAREAKLREEFEAMTRGQQEQFKKDLIAAQQTVQTQSAQQKAYQEFVGQVDGLINKPEYAKLATLIPHARAHIMSQLQQINPATKQEALDLSEAWLKERMEIFKKLSVAEQQAAQAAAVGQKMESNAGTAPAIPATTRADKVKSFIGKNGKPNWSKMFEDASKHSMS